MNPKRISRLVAGALAIIAASNSFAGQIMASSLSVARESITTDTQSVRSPAVSYRFAGDINALVQEHTSQLQFTLAGSATWASAGLASSITVTNGIYGTVVAQGTGAGQYSVTALGLSADKKTVFATLTVHSGAGGLIGQPVISIASSATAADNQAINNLKTVISSIDECDTTVKTLAVSVKHYVALNNPASLATDATAVPDEHVRAASTNTVTLMTFPTNVLVKLAPTGGNSPLALALIARPGLAGPRYPSLPGADQST